MLSLNPNLSAFRVQRLLQASADKVSPGPAQYDSNGFSLEYGYGRLNAYQALLLAKQTPMPDDHFEPNNTRASAHSIEKGFYSALACLNDDWYSLSAEANQEISAEIYFVRSRGQLKMELYNPSGTLMAQSFATSYTEQVDAQTQSVPGKWYLRVFGKDGATNYYHLVVRKLSLIHI